MIEELEELDISGLELELIERANARFHFPVVSISKDVIYFNRKFASMLNGCEYVKIYTTPEYVVLKFSDDQKENSYKVHTKTAYGYVTIPVNLREKKLAQGYYKVYRCKDGYAFKRYEKIGDIK